MKTLEIELPDQLAIEIERLAEQGWGSSPSDVARLALTEFVRRNRLELHERFQRDDIAWALQQKPSCSISSRRPAAS